MIVCKPSGSVDKRKTLVNFLLSTTAYCPIDKHGLPELPPIDGVIGHLRTVYGIDVSVPCVSKANQAVLKISQRSTHRPKVED